MSDPKSVEPDATTPEGEAPETDVAAPEVEAPAAETPATQQAIEGDPEPEGELVADSARVSDVVDPRRIRRAPRFGSFVFVGIFLAALVSGLLSFVRDSFLPPEQLAGRALDGGGMFLVLFIFFGATFVLIAFGIAVWLDRRSMRRG